MLSSWICLLGSVLCGAQESQLVTRELERAQIEGALVALGSLNSPCRFRLDAVEILIARTDPFFESLPGRELMALCESGADGSASTRCEDLHAAFEALSQDFEPRALNFSWRRFELDVAMTPEQQVQRSPHAFDEQTASLYKCPAFNLIYDNYEGSRHQLRLSSPSASPLLFDLHLLMSPVMFEPFQLHGWREYTWEELEGIDPGVLAVRLAPRGAPQDHYRLELSRESGMPLSASVHYASFPRGARNVGVFRYAPVARGAALVWLSDALQITQEDESLNLGLYRISELSFELDPQTFVLDVVGQTSLFDNRGSESVFLGTETSDWPPEVLQRVSFHPELSAYRVEHDEASEGEDSTSQALTWIGVLLMIAGAAYLIGSRRGVARRA